jgi:hypothetical protein
MTKVIEYHSTAPWCVGVFSELATLYMLGIDGPQTWVKALVSSSARLLTRAYICQTAIMGSFITLVTPRLISTQLA